MKKHCFAVAFLHCAWNHTRRKKQITSTYCKCGTRAPFCYIIVFSKVFVLLFDQVLSLLCSTQTFTLLPQTKCFSKYQSGNTLVSHHKIFLKNAYFFIQNWTATAIHKQQKQAIIHFKKACIYANVIKNHPHINSRVIIFTSCRY